MTYEILWVIAILQQITIQLLFHWKLFKERPGHIHTWKPLSTTSLICWPMSSSTGAVGIKGLAQRHLGDGDKGGSSAAFNSAHLSCRSVKLNSGHKRTSLTFWPPLLQINQLIIQFHPFKCNDVLN